MQRLLPKLQLQAEMGESSLGAPDIQLGRVMPGLTPDRPPLQSLKHMRALALQGNRAFDPLIASL